MRTIRRELALPTPPEKAFGLLVRPSAIREWWSAARAIVSPRLGGLWIAAWGADEDAPDFITVARITVFDPPRKMRLSDFEYVAKGSVPPAFTPDLVTEFQVHAAPCGSLLRVEQWGFPRHPEADEFFAACQTGWDATLEGIRRYVANGERSACR